MSARLPARPSAGDDKLSDAAALDMRLTRYAEDILERVMHRRRWVAVDRDRLVDRLRHILRVEDVIARPPVKSRKGDAPNADQ